MRGDHWENSTLYKIIYVLSLFDYRITGWATNYGFIDNPVTCLNQYDLPCIHAAFMT